MGKVFQVQVDTSVVRNPDLSAKAFVTWVRLTQLYHGSGQKDEIQLLHKKLMEYTKITDNRTFKEILLELHRNNLIINMVSILPRNDPIVIEINVEHIPVKNKKLIFTQLTESVINKKVIDKIGHIGVRLLYYYASRINMKSVKTLYCFAPEELIAEEIGIARKSVIKYNKLLEKMKFIKIEKQKVERAEYVNANRDISGFWIYNNHVYLRVDKIDNYVRESVDKITI